MAEVKKYYIETFGCQMNVADSEVVAAILNRNGLEHTKNLDEADIYLINTCAVRENAERRIWNKIENIKGLKKRRPDLILGILGCMAQHIGNKFNEINIVNFIAGPDSYRKLPELIKNSDNNSFNSELELSLFETYENIIPARFSSSTISGFVSITRGCNNFCSYCIVPYTRGRERSRNPVDILQETKDLISRGYREIFLLGQNVNSYLWDKNNNNTDFPDLLKSIAERYPDVRLRFTTSHPKDISDKLIEYIGEFENICNHIHLPVQSGSNKVLRTMNRKYTRENYLNRINKIKETIPACGLSTDIFVGFPGESADDYKESLELMKTVNFDSAFMFKYSERPGTYAARHMNDNVPEEVKTQRLNELIDLQNNISKKSNQADLGKTFEIMVEGKSKRSDKQVFGRTCHNKVVIIDDNHYKPGEKVKVEITSNTSATLFGKTK